MFERYLGEYDRINEELCELIDEEDNKVDQDTFVNRYSEFKRFIEKVNNWIAKVMKDPQDEEDDVSPHDSVSKANSVVSRTSSTSSAKLRIKAEREALLARAAAMKKREAIEQEETRLRLKKEQLEIEIELAVSDAKLKVYEEFEDVHESVDDFLKPTTRSRAESLKYVGKKTLAVLMIMCVVELVSPLLLSIQSHLFKLVLQIEESHHQGSSQTAILHVLNVMITLILLQAACLKCYSVRMKSLRCSSNSRVCLNCLTETYQRLQEIL